MCSLKIHSPDLLPRSQSSPHVLVCQGQPVSLCYPDLSIICGTFPLRSLLFHTVDYLSMQPTYGGVVPWEKGQKSSCQLFLSLLVAFQTLLIKSQFLSWAVENTGLACEMSLCLDHFLLNDLPWFLCRPDCVVCHLFNVNEIGDSAILLLCNARQFGLVYCNAYCYSLKLDICYFSPFKSKDHSNQAK